MGARKYFNEEERRAAKRSQDHASHQRRKKRTGLYDKRSHHSRNLADHPPPAYVIAERDRAMSAKYLMDFTAQWQGDPPPGRRAIDQREG